MTKINSVAILGGSFDPPHLGHLQLARAALKELKVNKVSLLPCYEHAFGKKLTKAEHRLKMLELLIENEKNMDIDDCEIRRQGVSHTLTTLKAIQKQNPEQKIYYIIGHDVLLTLNRWPNWEQLFNYCSIAVFSRKGYQQSYNNDWLQKLIKEKNDNEKQETKTNNEGKILFINSEIDEISATNIRAKLKAKDTPSPLEIPDNIINYTKQHLIYI